MDFKRPLIIGMGEIGKPLHELVKGIYPDAQWLDIETIEIDRISKEFDLDVSNVKDFVKSTMIDNEGKVRRPIYYGGFIEVPCVIKTLCFSKMHFLQFSPDILLESNQKRKIK